MTITWNRRERKDHSLAWKALIAVGVIGLGLGAAYLRKRVKVRLPKSEVTIGRGRATAKFLVHADRRGRAGVRRNSRARRKLVVTS